MAKDKTGAADKTPDLLARPRGRPAKGDKAMTGAERVAALRAARKDAGLCQACGQKNLSEAAKEKTFWNDKSMDAIIDYMQFAKEPGKANRAAWLEYGKRMGWI